MNKKYQIAVIGSAGIDDYQGKKGGATTLMNKIAYDLGKELALQDVIVVTGGKDGIMESASKGAKDNGGTTVGVIKGKERFTSNNYIDIEVLSGATSDGLDEQLIIQMADGVIGVGGGAGTLQEYVLAYRNNKPIVILENTGGWSDILAQFPYLDERERVEIITVQDSKKAVEKILKKLKSK